jgi:hypothetical protein
MVGKSLLERAESTAWATRSVEGEGRKARVQERSSIRRGSSGAGKHPSFAD